MPVDAQIPLMGKPVNVMSPFDLAQGQNAIEAGQQKNALMGMELQQHQQALQTQNAMLQVFQRPGMRDEKGLPTVAAVNEVGRFAPDVAMKMANALVETRHKEAQTTELGSRAQKEQIERSLSEIKLGREANNTMYGTYTAAKQAGASEEEATQQANTKGLELHDQYGKSGAIQNLKPFKAMTPQQMLANVMSADEHAKMLMDQQKGDRQVEIAQMHEDARAANLDKTLAASDARQIRGLSAIASRIGEGGKPPSGYRWSKENPDQLEAIAGGPAFSRQEIAATKEDQRRLDKIGQQYNIKDYSLGERTASRAEEQLTSKQGYQSVTPEQARGLVNQAKLMMDNYRSRTGGKYQDDQVNRMNSFIGRVEKYVSTIGEGEKLLAKDEMLNLAKEMKNIYADRNADLLRTELNIAQSTGKKGGNSSVLTMQGKIDDAIRYGRAKKVTIDGKDYLVFGEKGRKVTPDDMFELPER